MALHFLLRSAIDEQRFDHLAFGDFDDERDALLSLLEIYRIGPDASPPLQTVKARLEVWLIGNLETRRHADVSTAGDIANVIRVIASRSYDAMREWLATSASREQADAFRRLEADPCIEVHDGVPVSALFRAALHGLLTANNELQPERLGAHALLAMRDHGDAGELLSHVIPDWEPRMIRGARWQSDVDSRFFRDIHQLLATHELKRV